MSVVSQQRPEDVKWQHVVTALNCRQRGSTVVPGRTCSRCATATP